MSQIEVAGAPALGVSGPRTAGGNVRSANSFAMWALLALLVLAPLPLGSARPFFWSFSAAYLGLVTAVYAAFQLLFGARIRVDQRALAFPAVMSILLCLFLVLQMLPLGNWIGAFQIPNHAGAVLLANTISVAPNETLLMLLRQISYVLFFLLMLQVAANGGRRHLVLNVMVWNIVFYGIYGIVSLHSGDTILGVPKWAYLGSATGPFVNRNSFATYLAFGSVIALAMFVNELAKLALRNSAGRALVANMIMHGVAYVVLVMVVIATNSRMGLVVTLAGTTTVLLSAAANGGSRKPLMWILLAASIIMLGVLLYLGPGMIDRLGDVASDSATRSALYRQVWDMVQARPILGFGGGTFELAFPLFHRPPVEVDFIWNRAHNSYLALWADLGLLAGSIPMTILLFFGVRIARPLLRTRTIAQPGGDWLVQTIAIGVLVVSALHSLVDFSLEVQANTYVFLALVALGVATTTRIAQRTSASQ